MHKRELDCVISFSVQGTSKVIGTLQAFHKTLREAKTKAMYEAGSKTMKEIRFFIESGGNGTWPASHPMTKTFSKQGKSDWRKSERPGNFYGLGKFARFLVGKTSVITGFGASEKSGLVKFSRPLMGYAKSLAGQRIPVTTAMRKRFAATGSQRYTKERKPGITYFPLKKSTSMLIVPRRLIRFNVEKILQTVQSSLEKFFDHRPT